jgi:glutamate synthase domain-containing protein 2
MERTIVNYVIINRYFPPVGDSLGFWARQKIEEIRYAVTNGVEKTLLSVSRRGRILDRLCLRDLREEEIMQFVKELGVNGIDKLDVDVGINFASKYLSLPIYIGDMSFGALAKLPNIVLAEVADKANVVVGVGEGGLHPDVGKHKNIVVQWASGRFGIDRNMLKKGLAINIKIGQGAKPGIGGHLPGEKVVDEIAKVRKIPPGTEALSPAPHHDIYSIEDLAQRVRMLHELTGKPILVKSAASNQIGFIVVGIARSGALGAIVDGAGAGTGAAPRIIRDHVGLPIDFAIPVADKLLRENGVRDGFILIGGGMISSGSDIFKLLLLGANMANVATAALIAMGCIMCHQCNTGNCPAALTSSLTMPRMIDVKWAIGNVLKWLKAVERTLKVLTYLLGESSLQKLVGRRDLLELYNADDKVCEVIGVECAEPGAIVWYKDYDEFFDIPREIIEFGKTPVVGMGGIVPGYTTPAERPIDLLRIEAAQVTRPPVDPYREEIDLRITTSSGNVYEAPIAVPCIDEALTEAASALGIPTECDLANSPSAEVVPPGMYPSKNATTIIIDETLRPHPMQRPFLEEWVVKLDELFWKSMLRGNVTIVASGLLRHGADIYKMIALGADIVVPKFLFHSLYRKVQREPRIRRIDIYENILVELMWELRLLMGAGGVTSIKSLNGNRWLLRSLDGFISEILGVDMAGR